MSTAAEVKTYREMVAADLAANRRHVVNVLRDPEPALAAMPVGDLLCCCDGLEEAAVSDRKSVV